MMAERAWMAVILGPTAFLASLSLSKLARRYALARALIDVPNERSSHSVPTPKGGGIAIAGVVLIGLAVLAVLGQVGARSAIALSGGGALVAVVGWLDDHHGLSAGVRLTVHLAAAAWAVAWLRGMPDLTTGEAAVHLGPGGALLAVIGVVWATNFYNFMDGIDGLAAAEAVVVGVAGALLLASRATPLALVSLLIAAAAAGFLVWNWPPARLFMGDVGSGFLGFMFGGLALATENARALPALLWLVLLGPFFADATITLLRRMARGDRWHAAHRTHAYQRAVQAGWSHRRVTAVVAALSGALGLAVATVIGRPELQGPVIAAAGGALAALYLAVERRRPMPPAREGQDPDGQRSTGELSRGRPSYKAGSGEGGRAGP
jgi:Fuc2NAc and GlcNAc transferase